MSTDQRASERVGELIHNAFESLLQVNTDLERLQDLIGLGMDLRQLFAPHSQTAWKFMVPQEKRLRENWEKFISALEGVDSSSIGATSPPQVGAEPAAGAVGLVPAPALVQPATAVPLIQKVESAEDTDFKVLVAASICSIRRFY
jgi:hypothetical protein